MKTLLEEYPNLLNATVDWGDGEVTESTMVQLPGSGTFSDSHVYAVPQFYTITVTVQDNDGGTDTATLIVIVKGVGKMTGGGRVDTGEEEPARGRGNSQAIHTTHGFELVFNEDGSFNGNLQYNDHRNGDVL